MSNPPEKSSYSVRCDYSDRRDLGAWMLALVALAMDPAVPRDP
jgi:hypothetical protein